jgi:hypothetical protein
MWAARRFIARNREFVLQTLAAGRAAAPEFGHSNPLREAER